MKIGIDIRPLMQSHYSGVSEYTYQLLNHLFELDPHNEYLLFYNAHKDLEKNLPRFNFPNVTFKGFNLPNKLLNLSFLIFRYPKIDRLLGGIDILFLPNINFSASSTNTKLVIMVHDLSFERHPEFFDLKHKLWHTLRGAKELIGDANHLLAASKSTKRDVHELYNVSEEIITVTYEGLDPQFIDFKYDETKATAIQEKYNLPEKYILYLGTLEPRKNVTSIIEALDNIPLDYHLVLAGRMGWKYDNILKAAGARKDRVVFLDYVDKEDKPYLYNSATLFVWPSYYEGFGLPPLEAQASGTPVVVGANSSLVEVIGNSGLLVNVDNVNEISQAINAIINDEQLRNSLIKKGFENSKRFRWKQTAQKTVEVFNSILNT